MGRHTNSDICNFAAHVGDLNINELNIANDGWIQVWEAAEAGKDKLLYTDVFVKVINDKCFAVHCVNSHEISYCGEDDIWCFAVSKKEYKRIQKDYGPGPEDSYAPGLDLRKVCFAGENESVEKFLSDLKIKTKIYKTKSLQQTV